MSQLINSPFDQNQGLSLLRQNQQISLERGDFFQEPEESSISQLDAIGAFSAKSPFVGGLVLGLERLFVDSSGPEINPYTEIMKRDEETRERNEIFGTNDPILMELPEFYSAVERGHFEHSYTMELLDFDIESALLYQHAAETIQKASNRQLIVSLGFSLAGDPTNLIPGGVAINAAKSLKKLSTAQKIAVASSIAGAGTLTLEKIGNEIQPITNDPSLSNELFAFSIGAAVGGAFSGLSLKAMPSARKVMSTKKTKRINQLVNEAMHIKAPVSDNGDQMKEISLIANDSYEFANLLKELDPVDNQRAAILRTPKTIPVINEIKAKYKKAGKSLHLVEHPSQRLYKYIEIINDYAKISDNALAATTKDLDQTRLDQISRLINQANLFAQDKFLPLVQGPNPEARLTRLGLGATALFHRALSGSTQTVSKGNAASPMSFISGTSADGNKLVVDNLNMQVIRSTRNIIRNARQEDRDLFYNGQTFKTGRLNWPDHARIRSAIGDYMRRKHTAEHFNGVGSIPEESVDPLIIKVSKEIDQHFKNWLTRLDDVGIIKRGPKALLLAQKELKESELNFDDISFNLKKLSVVEDGKTELSRKAQKLIKQRGKAKEVLANKQKIKDEIQASVDVLKKSYFPQVWKVPKIEESFDEFVQDLSKALYKSNQYINGVFVDSSQTPLRVEIIEEMLKDKLVNEEQLLKIIKGNNLDQAVDFIEDSQKTLFEQIDGLVESDLSGELLNAYKARLDAFYRGNAQTVAKRLVDPIENHGVGDAIRNDPTVSRAMRIVQTDMSKWLEDDIEAILNQYNRAISGRWAIAQAVQSVPEIQNIRTQNGKHIKTGDDVRTYWSEIFDAMKSVARIADSQKSERKFSDAVNSLSNTIKRDMFGTMDIIEGKRTLMGDTYKPFDWGFSRFSEVSMMNKLGSVFWSTLPDAAVQIMIAAQNPISTLRMAKTIRALSKASKSDLQLMGLFSDDLVRTRAMTDLTNPSPDIGVGVGRTRRVTAKIQDATRIASDTFARVNLLNASTNLLKRYSAMQADYSNLLNARKLLRASDLIDKGMEESAALRKVGLSQLRAAQLNKLGLNKENAKLMIDTIYKHGTTIDGDLISLKMDKNTFMKSKDVFIANIQDWDLKNPKVRNLYEVYSSNMAALINRNRVVTPGPFDSPRINRTAMGRAFNQFQSFQMAFVNQRMRTMSQYPIGQHLGYLMTYIGLGAIASAISNHFAGRRTFEESAKMWEENPGGMVYEAWDRSGLTGWLARPIAVADQFNLPFAPANIFGHKPEGTSARHVTQGLPLLMIAGPVGADISRAAIVGADVLSGAPDANTAFNASKLIPGQNLIWLRMLNSMHKGISGDENAFQIAPEQFIRDRIQD